MKKRNSSLAAQKREAAEKEPEKTGREKNQKKKEDPEKYQTESEDTAESEAGIFFMAVT